MNECISYSVWLNEKTQPIYNGYIYGDGVFYLDNETDMIELYNLFKYDYDSERN